MINRDFIRRTALALRTQDNRITSHPLFIVQQKRRTYGIDTGWTEATVWLDEEGSEVDGGLARSLEAGWKKCRLEPAGYTRVGYHDTWEFVTACLTEDGAKDYIRLDGHDLREPRIYVTSGHRNKEWQMLRALILALDEEAV